jgi:hypothetical protein
MLIITAGMATFAAMPHIRMNIDTFVIAKLTVTRLRFRIFWSRLFGISRLIGFAFAILARDAFGTFIAAFSAIQSIVHQTYLRAIACL